MGSLASVVGGGGQAGQGSTPEGWGTGLSLPARNKLVSSGQPRVWGAAPSHLQAPVPSFPASLSDTGVLIKGAMSICP